MRRLGFWAGLMLGVLLLCGGAGQAQTASPPPARETEAVDSVLAPLSDAEARAMLRERLKAEAEAAQRTASGPDLFGGLLIRLREAGQALRDRKEMIAITVEDAPARLRAAVDRLSSGGGWPEIGFGFVVLVTALLGGLIAELAVARYIGREPIRDICADRPAYGERLSRAGHYFMAGLLHNLIFALVAYCVAVALLSRADPLREMVFALALILIAARLFMLVADSLLAPLAPERRIADTVDDNGLPLQRGLVAFGTAVTAAALLESLLRLLGLPMQLLALFEVICGTLIAAAMLAVLIQRGLARKLAGIRAARRGLFVAVLVIGWLVWTVDVLVGWSAASRTLLLALILLVLLPLVEAALRGLLTGVDDLRGPVGATPEARARQKRFDDAVLVVLRVVIGLAAAALAAQAGGLGAGSLFESGMGRRILEGAVSIGTTLLVAAIVWEAISISIDRKLGARFATGGEYHPQADPEDEAANVATRAETLLPLVRTFLWFAMVAIVGMIGLSSVGVNIGPLLAGAGVVGLAIGFGAQTLVRDIVSGIFFLIDDAFRIGEYIEFGNIRGEVEKISIRSLTLRHHRGAIHVVPFGELKVVTNYNRDWAIFKMEFSVPYDTDVEKVRKIIKNIGQELLADPEHGRKFLEPVKSQGVVAFAESAIVIRIKFKCKPREQFVLRRVVSSKIKQAFDRNGISFAYPRVVVEAPGAATPEAAAAAARAIAAEQTKPAA